MEDLYLHRLKSFFTLWVSFKYLVLKEFKGAQSRYLNYFGHIQNYLNTKEIKIRHKGTRVVMDGEDLTGLQRRN